MRKHESQNEKVDQLANRLMGQTMLTDGEIDKIIASPMLYSSIRSRVNATPEAKPGFAWFRIPAVAAFASILIVVGVTSFVFYRNGKPVDTVNRVVEKPPTVANNPAPFKKSAEPDGISPDFSKPAKSDQPQSQDSRMTIQNASYRKPIANSVRAPRPIAVKQPDLEFIPLVYTEDPAESLKGGRVIRVELPRASLFAMGISVPLENGSETVKADLLVGQDGVPRGIRMPH